MRFATARKRNTESTVVPGHCSSPFSPRYNDVLEGRELVSYLVAGRACLSREEAQHVGRALQRCGVLTHVTQEHNFHDLGYFYRFDVERWRALRHR